MSDLTPCEQSVIDNNAVCKDPTWDEFGNLLLTFFSWYLFVCVIFWVWVVISGCHDRRVRIATYREKKKRRAQHIASRNMAASNNNKRRTGDGEEDGDAIPLATMTAAATTTTATTTVSVAKPALIRAKPNRIFSWKKWNKRFRIIDSFASSYIVGLWVARTYEQTYPAFHKVSEILLVTFFTIHFACRLYAASANLMGHLLTPYTVIDALTITSTIWSVETGLWLNFSFFRFVSVMNSGPFDLLARWLQFGDFDVQIIALVERVLLIVIGFACTIMTYETLGEISFFEFPEDSVHLDSPWTFFNSIYFIFITLSTVGYGDMSPSTVVGRFHIIVFVVVGIVTFGEASSRIVELGLRKKGGHGTNAKGGNFVLLSGKVTVNSVCDFLDEFYHPDRLRLEKKLAYRSIVILMEREEDMHLLKQQLYDHVNINSLLFLVGSLISERDLKRCNLHNGKCEAVFVMGDDTNEGVDEEFIHDVKHIFGTISLKLFVPHVPVYLLLFSSSAEQRLSATACSPDFVLARDRVNMSFMALSAIAPGFSTMMHHLLVMTEELDDERSLLVEKLTERFRTARKSLLDLSHGGALPLEDDLQVGRVSHKELKNWAKEYREGAEKELNVVQLDEKYTQRPFCEVALEIYQEREAYLLGYITRDGFVHLQAHGLIPLEAQAVVITEDIAEALEIGTLITPEIAYLPTLACQLDRQKSAGMMKKHVKKVTGIQKLTSKVTGIQKLTSKVSSFAAATTEAVAAKTASSSTSGAETKHAQSSSSSKQQQQQFPQLLVPGQKQHFKDHIVMIVDKSDFDGVKHFIRPVRIRETLLKRHAVPDIPTQAIVLVCAEQVDTEQVFRHFTEHERNAVYIVHGSPFQRLTLDIACVSTATRVVVVGANFDPSDARRGLLTGNLSEADVVFVLQGIESYLATHGDKDRYVHVMTQVTNPETIKFLSDPVYDAAQPLSETTVFAQGKLYANSMARMMLIGNFFNPQILNVFRSFSTCLDHEAGGCVLHQIAVKHIRAENVGWRGTTMLELVTFLTEHGVMPLSVFRNNRHERGICCTRHDGIVLHDSPSNNSSDRKRSLSDADTMITAPTKFAFVAPKHETILCDLDEVVWFGTPSEATSEKIVNIIRNSVLPERKVTLATQRASSSSSSSSSSSEAAEGANVTTTASGKSSSFVKHLQRGKSGIGGLMRRVSSGVKSTTNKNNNQTNNAVPAEAPEEQEEVLRLHGVELSEGRRSSLEQSIL